MCRMTVRGYEEERWTTTGILLTSLDDCLCQKLKSTSVCHKHFLVILVCPELLALEYYVLPFLERISLTLGKSFNVWVF